MNFFNYNVCNRLYRFFRYYKIFHVFYYIFLEICIGFHFDKWNVITTPLKHVCIIKFPKFFPWELILKKGEILSGYFKIIYHVRDHVL
jgi:hypothetical protein